MRSYLHLLLLFCIIAVATHAQDEQSPSLHIGDPAPPLRLREWIKGEPIQKFKKGKLYVVEFWATWCSPCRAAMPHLSALANQYRGKLTIIGIDILENKTREKVKAFVDSMGNRMDYHVAAEDSNFMETGWLSAFGESGIPKSFVINAEGTIAWIGHPKDLDKILPEIVNRTWDIKEASAKQKLEKHLAKLDEDAHYELANYWGDPLKPDDLGKPDSALLLINEIVRKEPKLKFAPNIAYQTFAALLKTNPQKAYEYGKAMLTSTYEDPGDVIINVIKTYSDKLNLPAEIYQLGAEAYQARIDWIPYPEILDMYRFYNKMAEWYSRANDKSKAISAQQKAIEALKSKKDFSATDLATFESQLQQYKNM